MTENSGNIREKNLIPFQPGQSGNPNGRPKGQRDYATIYREALIKLGSSLGKDPMDLEVELIQTGLLNAKKGDYRFYKDVLDRTHGKPVDRSEVDVMSGGEKLEKGINLDELILTVEETLKKKKLNGETTDKGAVGGE